MKSLQYEYRMGREATKKNNLLITEYDHHLVCAATAIN